jgi:hypothetical protein
MITNPTKESSAAASNVPNHSPATARGFHSKSDSRGRYSLPGKLVVCSVSLSLSMSMPMCTVHCARPIHYCLLMHTYVFIELLSARSG